MELRDLAAWVGAANGTAALGWKIYEWRRTGPRLVVRGRTDIVLMPVPEGFSDEVHLMVTVTNVGTAATTLTALGMRVHNSRWHRFATRIAPRIVKSTRWGVALPQNLRPLPLPHLLEPATEWTTLIPHGNEWITAAKADIRKVLELRVSHTMGQKRDAYAVVRFRKRVPKATA